MNTITRNIFAIAAMTLMTSFASAKTVEPVQFPVRVTETQGVSSTDVAISDAVSMAILKNEKFNDWNVAISTKNGVVTLTGTAPSAKDIATITKVVQDVKGVQSVQSKITIGSLPEQPLTIKVITGEQEDKARQSELNK